MASFDHVGIYVKDMEKSLSFYQDLFGFPEHSRLWDGDIEIVFLDMGGGLLQLKRRPAAAQPSSGKWSHFAIHVEGYDEFVGKLKEKGIEYWEIALGEGQRLANFTDPDGHDLEVCEKPFK